MFAEMDPTWSVIAFLFYFLGTWLFVCCLIATAGGWHTLAEVYRDANPPRHWPFNRESIRLRGIGRYGRCISGAVTADGLHLSVLFFFRMMHPPLFIPMAQIDSVVAERCLFFTRYTVYLEGTGVTISLYDKFGEATMRAWQASRREAATP
jgi:hypothetical protein